MKWHYLVKRLFTIFFIPANTLDLMMKRNKYRVTELIKIVQWKQVINFDVQKSNVE